MAHIIKKQPEKWFYTNEITLQALKLDNQSIDNGASRLHLQTIHSALNHLVKHSLVEKKLERKTPYWRFVYKQDNNFNFQATLLDGKWIWVEKNLSSN